MMRSDIGMKNGTILRLLLLNAAILLPLLVAPVRAQQADADPHAGHDAAAKSTDQMNHDAMSGADMPMDMDMEDMSDTDMSGAAPAGTRDPHAYADGYDFGPFPLHLADEHSFASLRVDRLETVRTDDNTATTYDLQGWYGRDYDRIVLKAEGDIDNGGLEEATTELLWGHAIATFWDAQLGVRHDSGDAPDRTWLAFGVQGLAPYWFEVDAAAYAGESGRTALNVEVDYELLFTQRLILQPRVAINFYGKNDTARGLGSGLSDVAAGLRLRYEFRREFAPYLGIEWAGQYGGTADLSRAAGQETSEARALAGVRFWF